MALIEVKDLCKDFQVYKRQKGFVNNFKSFFVRQYETKNAVQDVNFSIEGGELVGYIGANGAGKSTTIKMLSGILVPTSGQGLVDGKEPYKNRKENSLNIGVVFGQRSQLNWDLPMEDTFELYKRMYKVPGDIYKKNVEMCVELMDMQPFLRKPVRQLSLGQKMRAEIAIALLHSPQILYLDEPTIGLDVLVKDSIRKFVRQLNRESRTTVMLTTHDMNDIDQICDRIIMIDEGRIIHDGSLIAFKQAYSGRYNIDVELLSPIENIAGIDARLHVIKSSEKGALLSVSKDDMTVKDILSYLSAHFDIADVKISQPSIEEIVRDIYAKRPPMNMI